MSMLHQSKIYDKLVSILLTLIIANANLNLAVVLLPSKYFVEHHTVFSCTMLQPVTFRLTLPGVYI